MKLNPSVVQSLHHAALCCQSKDHSSGFSVSDGSKSLRSRLLCYEHLRLTCLNLTPGEDGVHQNLYEYFVDMPDMDNLDEALKLTNAGVFVQRLLGDWGLEYGIDPFTGEARVWYADYSEESTGLKVTATAEQVASLNRVCTRYKRKPNKLRLTSELVRQQHQVKVGTLFADFGNILIGIEPDGYSHS